MRVILDTQVCDAHGECVITAPEVFDIGHDDDVATLLDPEPPEHLRAKVEEAALNCPVLAIRIEG